MINQVGTSLYNRLKDEFETRQHKNNGRSTDDLSKIRSSAFDIFKSKGFPSIKEEDWRFTSLVPYLDINYNLEAITVRDTKLLDFIKDFKIPSLDAYRLVLVNETIHPELSTLPDEETVTIQPLKNMSSSNVFTENISSKDHVGGKSMVALNTAFFKDGFYLEVKKNAVVDKPIEILHVYTNKENVLFQPRHLTVVNESAKVEIIETSVVYNSETTMFINSVSEFIIKENAQVAHYHIQSNAADERWLHYTEVKQQANSRFDNFTFCLPGADLIRNNLEIRLNGSNTETHLYGLYLVAGRQLTDNHTSIDHNFPNCQSNEIYKGVLMDRGKAVFNGKVFVEREAQQTNAFQQNNNLLLSDKAQVYAKPQLEIFADDVKCSHGCTIGQFDPESLFYLRSRGIGEDAARKLMVEAFLFDVTDKITNSAVKQYLKELIYKKLENSYANTD